MGSEKNWNRPWSAEEIIENADKWSLAGDVALLNTMKQFANNLLTKTDHLNSNINDLLNDLNEVGLQLDLSQNEFQSLKNTQFIESRVYDDDETLDSKENERVLDKNDNQLEEETQIDINLTLEVKLLDKYFETVEITVSDSEDESEKSFVLKPVDVYTDRPLPPIIGSEEWYTNWYLEDEISDIDSEKSEVYSDSDNDNNLPKDLMFMSETSSEDYSHTATENKPVANSTLKNATKRPESIVSSEESECSNYLPTKPPISNKTFVEQLTAKLDRVSKDGNISEKINSKPIQPIGKNSFSGLFADEPPPLSDSEDVTTKGIFSGGSNIFDEDDDEDMLFGSNKKNSYYPQNMQKDKNIDTGSDNDILPQSSQISKGLFDSDNSDEEIVSKNHNKQNTFLQSHKTIVPLINDEPPAIDVSYNLEPSTKKKPIEEVSVFGKQNINELMKKTQKREFESPEYDKSKYVSQKTLNLFDDNDEDIFNEIVTKPITKKYNLFNDLNEENEQKSHSEISQKKKNISSLFDDDDEVSEKEDDLFNVPKKNQEKRFNLFDDGLSVDPTMNKNEKLDVNPSRSIEDVGSTPIGTKFDISNEAVKKFSNNFSKVDLLGKDNQLKSTSLFDDNEEDDEDDIFANVTKKIDFKLFEEPESSDYLFTSIKKEVNTESALKIANIERTEDYLKNTIDENLDKTIKEADNIISSQSSDNKINEVLEESCTDIKKGRDDLFDGNNKLDNNNDLFKEATKIETSTKPPIAQKPHSTSSKETTSNENIFESKIPPSDTVPVSFMSTSPIANDTSYHSKAKLPPVVDLFSSTPPPDDYTWDNKSDTLSDTEDFLGYQIDQNNRARSSLFDNDPPSLNEDESTGVVRDLNNTSRIDTDNNSSFNPNASSSRSLSSDIFIEQQFQDSLFVTKQQLTDCRNNPSQFLGITSSERIDDSSIDEQNNGKYEIKIENKDETDERDSKRIGIASITEMLKNQNQKEMTENRVSPGKLKQNLNINVNALLPGYSQPKIKSIVKLQSLDSTEDNLKNETWNNSTLNESKAGNTKDINRVVSEKPLGFDETDRVEVLPNITKERVRIPTKRRPSSRRGRQEAIRKSALEEFSPDDILKASGDLLDTPKQKVSDSAEAKISAEKQYVEENYENLKSTPEAISIKSPSSGGGGGGGALEEYKQDTTKNNLFGSGSESDNDLFGSQKIEIKQEKKSNPTSLNKSKTIPKRSLFNDSSSDDDLFLGNNRKSNKPAISAKVLEKKVRPTIKKLENVKIKEDPLSDLLK